MGYEEEREKLDKKYEQDVEALKRKHSILTFLGDLIDGYEQPSVFYRRLYGSVGIVNLIRCHYDSLRKGKDPDRALLLEAMRRFPPMPVQKIKDRGTTSFRPAGNMDGVSEEAEITNVYPVTVRIETYIQPARTFEWYALLNNELWEFKVEFAPWKTDLGSLDMKANYYPGSDKVASWEKCEFYPKWGAQRIRWASGSRDASNSFTLYWYEDAELDFAQMVKE
jgi:hypothetical protein